MKADVVTIDCVTLHAVTRFCQRLLEVKLDGPFKNAIEEAAAHCAAVNLTVAKVQSMILTNKVRLELMLGKEHVFDGLFWAVIKNRKVVTIQLADWRPPKSKMMQMTGRQMRQKLQQHARRLG